MASFFFGGTMGRYTRIVFGFNALYQTTVGVICLLAPATAVGLYGGTQADQAITMLLVAFRVIGVCLIPAGVVSALIAGNPDTYPILRPLMGLWAVLTLVCWGITIGAHNLNLSQILSVMFDVIVQVALLLAVVFYNPKVKEQAHSARRHAA
ncbi:MAG: hypothetical protein JO112_16560 [Planctomycetes bacterium]|nr:hypothetical protein [Planctomycetota bacterium]